jgi:ribosomal protein L32
MNVCAFKERKWPGPRSQSDSPSHGVKRYELRGEVERGNKGSEVKSFLGERAVATLGQAESGDRGTSCRSSFPPRHIAAEPVPQPRTLDRRKNPRPEMEGGIARSATIYRVKSEIGSRKRDWRPLNFDAESSGTRQRKLDKDRRTRRANHNQKSFQELGDCQECGTIVRASHTSPFPIWCK